MSKDFALNTAVGLQLAISNNLGAWQSFVAGSLFCSTCDGYQRIHVQHLPAETKALTLPKPLPQFRLGGQFSLSGLFTPALFIYCCVQCDSLWSVMLYPNMSCDPPQIVMALFSVEKGAGTGWALAPKGVSFYLTQAARCHSAGANSAAVVMCRSALEWLLLEQGYSQQYLGQKLSVLEKQLAEGNAPPWAKDLNPEYLIAIKDLGNTAIHTNGGDLMKQEGLNASLYTKLETTFTELIDVIYGQPFRREQRLRTLKEALRPDKPGSGSY